MSDHPADRPAPRNFKPSAKDAPGFRDAAARTFSAGAFASGGRQYDDVRPSYPAEVAALVRGAQRILDVGAGTGKLTETLVAPSRQVVALDPSKDMARVCRQQVPQAQVMLGKAEALPLIDASFDAYTCAQTWHWVDVEKASREADRVLALGGKLLLCWNTLDVTHPWVLRLSRISHSGDVHREGFYPEVAAPWRLTDELRMKWIQPATTDDLFALARTRSYWLRASEETRAKVTANLKWYLFERLGFEEGQLLPLPYRTDAFLYER